MAVLNVIHILVARVANFYCISIKNLLNGLSLLSLLKCLSRWCRKYLPILMLVNLQEGGINQTTFLFLSIPRLFEWLLLLISPTLMSLRVLPLLPLCLEVRSSRVKYSSLTWNPLFLWRHHIYLCSPRIFFSHEDSLLILWFTVLGICLSTDLGWFKEIFMYLLAESFLLNVWKYHYLNLVWRQESQLSLSLRLFEFLDLVIWLLK